MSFYKHHVFFCCNQRDGGKACCNDYGASDIRDYAKNRVKELGLSGNGKVRINMAGCLDRCELDIGPLRKHRMLLEGPAKGREPSPVRERAEQNALRIAHAQEHEIEPLPGQHGFPARLIVPGLYGYVSATKWVAEIELTTREAGDGYWVPLGWAKDAPILTQSRIDVPRGNATLPAGPTTIAGVAWAPDRGISKVEVRVDDGPWTAAQLSSPISTATWRQWELAWSPASGSHTIEVRATDGTGSLQADVQTPPAPDGARGFHQVTVLVG
mgnify:CR=1 FL=1